MTKQAYIEKNFNAETLIIIQQANEIIEEYQESNLTLTLRQLYYQFVSRDLIANTQKQYGRLGKIISNGRLTGLIDWDAIEDRTRMIRGNSHWNNPGEIIRTAAYSFQLDHWRNQKYQPEVWIEKEALIGVISDICSDLDVPYFACKGYVSQSEMWKGAQRMKFHRDCSKVPVIIHLGDHDPSGMDMTRDILDRHNLFGGALQVRRIALNMDQIEHYQPPPNPTKLTDSRSSSYVMEYGYSSWELDALEPKVLQKLIQDEVDSFRDPDLYQETMKKEQEYKAILQKVANNWETL